jgi:hypothetical protein
MLTNANTKPSPKHHCNTHACVVCPVQVAVEEGVPIVPVYHFGNTLLFR